MSDLEPGLIAWVVLDPVRGRERGGRRPVLIVSGQHYLDVVDTLVQVVPITSVPRGWSNHVSLADALDRPSWAMTEQIRTVSRDRVVGIAGRVSGDTLGEVRLWLRRFLDL